MVRFMLKIITMNVFQRYLCFISRQTGENELQTQPPMLTFKQFMNSQDDHISDVEAVRKFSDYKTDFQKQQINEFFLQHKEEEWYVSCLQSRSFMFTVWITRRSLNLLIASLTQ